MASIDFKEYSRIRDIVQKRHKRLVQAGKMEPVHFPTVREIKSGWVDPGAALNAIKDFYSGGSTLKAVKQTGLVPTVPAFQEQPKPQPLTSAEKRERKRRSDRMYRQRQKIKNTAPDIAKERGRLNLLKAVDTMNRKGFNLFGVDISKMSPKEAAAFAEYLEYRLSQGDYVMKYMVDTFTREYEALKSQGHKPEDIKKDFERYLEDRSRLENKNINMEGLDSGTARQYWIDFIGYDVDELI